MTKITGFLFILCMLVFMAGFHENAYAKSHPDSPRLKLRVKKTGWYDLYNPSKTLESSIRFQNKKKNPSGGFDTPGIKKGKKVRVYLNKGTYYLSLRQRNPGDFVYWFGHFEQKPKLKLIKQECAIKPNKKQALLCDMSKGIFFKLKAPRTGIIYLDNALGGNAEYDTADLYDAKKQKIAGSLFEGETSQLAFGIQQGKTYYLKLQWKGISDETTYFRYCYENPDQNMQDVPSYGFSKETAVSINGFSQGVCYSGLIGLDGAAEEHWYTYDMRTPAFVPRFYLWHPLGWLNKSGFQIDYFDQNGSLLHSDTDGTVNPPVSDWESAGVSKVYVKLSSKNNCASQYFIDFDGSW